MLGSQSSHARFAANPIRALGERGNKYQLAFRLTTRVGPSGLQDVRMTDDMLGPQSLASSILGFPSVGDTLGATFIGLIIAAVLSNQVY